MFILYLISVPKLIPGNQTELENAKEINSSIHAEKGNIIVFFRHNAFAACFVAVFFILYCQTAKFPVFKLIIMTNLPSAAINSSLVSMIVITLSDICLTFPVVE